jgi:tetratricopeptide (TPR) repeat protein
MIRYQPMKKLILLFALLFSNAITAQETKQSPQELSQMSLDAGLNKANNGDWTNAINDYNTALIQDPKNAAAYYNRAVARFNLRDFRGAIMDYSKAIYVGTSTNADCVSSAYYGRGQCLYQLGQKEKACMDFVKSSDLGNQDGTTAVQNFCN